MHVVMNVPRYPCGGHRTTFENQFSPIRCGSGDQIHVISRSGKCLYPLRYLVDHIHINGLMGNHKRSKKPF